jgi:ankyrin repeat protein
LNVNGDSIIHHAASFGSNDIIDFLLNNKICDIDQRNEDDCTALHRAAFLGYLDTVKFLVKKGADTHAQDKNHLKPIDHAKTLHHHQVVSYLEETMNPYSDASIDPLDSPKSIANSIYFLDLSL